MSWQLVAGKQYFSISALDGVEGCRNNLEQVNNFSRLNGTSEYLNNLGRVCNLLASWMVQAGVSTS